MGLAFASPILVDEKIGHYGTLKVRQVLTEPKPLLPAELTAATLNE